MNDAFESALARAIEITSPVRIENPRDPHQILTEHSDAQRDRFVWRMYQGEQLPYLLPLPDESPIDFARRPHKQFFNVTRVVIDVLSQLYRRPPRRDLTGQDHARVREILNQNPLNLTLLAVDRLTRLHGMCALQADYRDGRVHFDLWPAHRLRVVPDPVSPRHARAVIAVAFGSHRLVHVWGESQFALVKNGRVVDERTHEYGRVPFVFFHDALPVDGFRSFGRGRELAYQNCEFNNKLSELAHTVAMQGFGVLQVVNPDPSEDLTLGPARMVRFHVSENEPHGIEFKSPRAPIDALVSELEFYLRTLLRTQRVPESALSVHVANNLSGVSVLAQQTPLLEDRIERRELFRTGESELVALTHTLLRVHEGAGETAPTLHLDYPEPSFEQNPDAQQRRDEWRLRHGLITPPEILMRDDPDRFATLDDARAQWRANQSEKEIDNE